MKKLIIVLLSIALCIEACACGTSERHIKKLKEQVPLATKLVEGNKELFDILLEVKTRISKYNESSPIIDDRPYIIDRLNIGIRDKITYGVYISYIGMNGSYRQADKELELLSPEEEEILFEILLNNLEGKCSERFITIMPESIYFRYLDSGNARLGIVNPSKETPEVNEWYEYKYATKINDDWGLEIFRTIPR